MQRSGLNKFSGPRISAFLFFSVKYFKKQFIQRFLLFLAVYIFAMHTKKIIWFFLKNQFIIFKKLNGIHNWLKDFGIMKVEVSIGELVDKVSILSIKSKKIRDKNKLNNIRKEYGILAKSMEDAGIQLTSDEFKRLEQINIRLWDIEDQIRIKNLMMNLSVWPEAFISQMMSVPRSSGRLISNTGPASLKKKNTWNTNRHP